METCKFDESNEQYSDAYYHIACATNAYIALTLKIDSEKVNLNYLLLNLKSIGLPIISKFFIHYYNNQ